MILGNVLVGKEDYHFLFSGQHKQFDYLSGKIKVCKKNELNFNQNISSRVKLLNGIGIDYRHIIFPSKPIVKKNFIPSEFSNVMSIYLRYYKNHGPVQNDPIIYSLNILRENDSTCSTFPKYDTHNSHYGFLLICNQLLKSLNLPLVPENLYSFSKKELGGDLVNMLESNKTIEEDYIHFKNTNEIFRTSNHPRNGNQDHVFITHNQNSLTKKRVLIFGDSFSRCCINFLENIFTEIFYIRSTFVHYDIVHNYKPDIVICGTAERYLDNVESDTSAKNFTLALYGNKNYNPNQTYLDTFKAFLSYRYYPHIYLTWLEKYI